MTRLELEQRINHIETVAELQKKAVYREFVETNAKYKVGDMVSDGIDTIRVEKIHYSTFRRDISIFYYGPLLTKTGTPRKDGTKRAVFETAIKNK